MTELKFEETFRPKLSLFLLIFICIFSGFLLLKYHARKKNLEQLQNLKKDLAKYEVIINQIEKSPPEVARVLSRAKPEYEALLKQKSDLETKLGIKDR